MLYQPPKTKTVDVVSNTGDRLAKVCEHPKVPGLDCEYCPICQVYFRDNQAIEQFEMGHSWGIHPTNTSPEDYFAKLVDWRKKRKKKEEDLG
ncbi:MAG TPA: hypothetical protein V6C65_23620 [Allocoleopsis sp.]